MEKDLKGKELGVGIRSETIQNDINRILLL